MVIYLMYLVTYMIWMNVRYI